MTEMVCYKMNPKRLTLITIIFCIASCTSTQETSRQSIPEPDFIVIPPVYDTTAVAQVNSFFYRYRFGSKEDDLSTTPEWALANLFHNGVNVAEAWYAESMRPKNPGNGISRTIYGPLFVVRLLQDDPYIIHLRYEHLESFYPDSVSSRLAYPLAHYIRKR